jgi:hypothetical protein
LVRNTGIKKCRPQTYEVQIAGIKKGIFMGFSGIRAVILIVVFVVLLLCVTKLDLPGWLLTVGLLLTAGVLKGAEKKASA